MGPPLTSPKSKFALLKCYEVSWCCRQGVSFIFSTAVLEILFSKYVCIYSEQRLLISLQVNFSLLQRLVMNYDYFWISKGKKISIPSSGVLSHAWICFRALYHTTLWFCNTSECSASPCACIADTNRYQDSILCRLLYQVLLVTLLHQTLLSSLAWLDSAVQSLVFFDFRLLLYVSWLGTCLVNDLSHLILVIPATNLHMDLFNFFFIHFPSICSLNCYIWWEVVALRLRIRVYVFRKTPDLVSPL